MSDHRKNPSGSLCAILFHILNLERIASHRGTCSNKGSSTDFNTDSWLSWNSPKGRWNTDSHNWPFFSSHVTISMSLWLFASLPKFLLMTVDRLQQNWVFSQSLEIFIWQQQCCVMAVTKMDIKICKPENYMYSWSTLSILILKISIMKTQLFCTDFGELWNPVQWLSNIFQGHINSMAKLRLPRHPSKVCTMLSSRSSISSYSRSRFSSAAFTAFSSCLKIIGMLQDAFKSHLLCPYWFNSFVPTERLKQLRNDAGIKKASTWM